jgi:hypothetical protein
VSICLVSSPSVRGLRMRSSTNMKQGTLLCGGKRGNASPALLLSSLFIRGFMYRMNRRGDSADP